MQNQNLVPPKAPNNKEEHTTFLLQVVLLLACGYFTIVELRLSRGKFEPP